MDFENEYEDSLKEKAFIDAEKKEIYDNENQNIMEPLNEIFKSLEEFDWSFEYSDDIRWWNSGRGQLTKIKKLIADHLANNIEDKKVIMEKAYEIQKRKFKAPPPFAVKRFFTNIKV
tara:strand:+ start:2481 stop:2831 length:351 start_codon:yes stop_codon:yes gene_type:complete